MGTEVNVYGHSAGPPAAPSPLPHSPQSRLWPGREDPRLPGRVRAAEAQDFVELSELGWSLAQRPARGGSWQNPEYSWPPHQRPGWHAGHSPQGCWNHWTGPCEDLEFKFYIYICKLGKISVYFSLTLVSIFFFLIEKNHRKRCL